jgi:hypothetical protein
MNTIFLNAQNISNIDNTQLTYNFPTTTEFKPGTMVAVQAINMFYSWFNINGMLYNNNKFSYKWWDSSGELTETHTITIDNGNYSIDTLNEALQNKLFLNKHYVSKTTSGTTNSLYFIEFISNDTKYKYQLNTYYMPTSAENTSSYQYTKPVGATWNFPTVGSTSQVFILDNGFSKLIGFSPGTYPVTPDVKKNSAVGDLIPQIDPVSSVIVNCSLVASKYSFPETVLYSFTHSTEFGGLINIDPPQYSWAMVKPGQYTSFTISFFDQNFSRMQILDSQMVIGIVIKEAQEQK